MKIRKIVSLLVLLFGVFVLGFIVFLWWQYLQLKPTYEDVSSSTIQQPVSIGIDSIGVAHIEAQNVEDAIEAMGYWVASQRLWQMELMRRTALGRLSELFGDTTLTADRLFRTLALEDVAIRIYETADRESRQWLDAYARGVNLYIQTTKELPIEFQLLQIEPEPWQPLHSILIERIMAWMLNFSWRADWVAALLKEKLPPRMFQQVVPKWPQQAPRIGQWMVDAEHLNALREVSRGEAVARSLLGWAVSGFGSNNWVISGQHTQSGAPILANDPHLMLSIPSVWIQVLLKTPEFTVAGFALPGAPGIVLGRNEYLAWGFTNGMVDDSDYLVPDKIDLNKEVIWINGVAENLEKVEHIIVSKGKKHTFSVYRYNNMPLFNPVFKRQLTGIPLFLQWSGFDVSNELETFIALAKARNVEEGIAAFEPYHVPAQNVVLADVDGNIGYTLSGDVPKRNVPGGLLPLPFQKGKWDGYYEFDQLPRIINPPSGLIYTANNKIEAGYYISDVWEPEFRAQRIREMLLDASRKKMTVQDVQSMQMDVLSLPARQYLPRWLSVITSAPGTFSQEENALLTFLKNWDFTMDENQIAPLLWEAWLKRIVTDLFKPQIGDTLFEELVRLPSLYLRMTFSILESNDAQWFGGDKTVFLRKTFQAAVKDLQKEYGEPQSWTWGKAHQLYLQHPMGAVPILRRIFNRGPYPVPGDPFTVNVGHYRFMEGFRVTVGASMRSVTELGREPFLAVNLPGGNSGNPFSQFYADQVDLWLRGNFRKIKLKGNQNWLYEFKMLPIKNGRKKE